MPKLSLIKAINTPPAGVIKYLEQEYQIIKLDGKSVPAYSLGKGGYGQAFLYKKGNEYRVAKLYHFSDDSLGNVERRAISFNNIYRTIYEKIFSPLATAKVIRGNDTFLDMPYIAGIDFFFDTNHEERKQKTEALFEYFRKHAFFVSDFNQRGNIVTFVDPISKKEYIFVRDVDLVGRRASYEQKGEHSVTHHILHKSKDSEEIFEEDFTNDFKSVLQITESKSELEPTHLYAEFERIKTSLLKLMGPSHPKYSALQGAADFPALCFIAAQKRGKSKFSKNEGSTKTLDNLLSLVNDKEISLLRTEFKLPKESDQFDLKEVGFYGELHAQGPDKKLRKSNLQFVYSIKNNTEEFGAKLSNLRSHSLFSTDFTNLLQDEALDVAAKGPVVKLHQ